MHKGDFARYIAEYAYRTLTWGQNHVPPGVRSIVGLMFIVGGVFGFLPILGFWMLPLGIAFVALDIPPARRHIDALMLKLHRRAYLDDPTSNQ